MKSCLLLAYFIDQLCHRIDDSVALVSSFQRVWDESLEGGGVPLRRPRFSSTVH
jgi:hypothetical protein